MPTFESALVGVAAEGLNQPFGLEDLFEPGLPLFPFALKDTHADYIVYSIISENVLPQAPLMPETKGFVQPYNSEIEVEGLTTELIEL